MIRIDRERTHHNAWARNKAHDISRDFDHFLSLENLWILKHLPPLKGQRVFDVGCGLGEASLYFARHGAHVTAVDISEGMVKHCVATIRREGLDIEGVVSSVEELKVENRAYDVIYVANVLHHLERPQDAIRKISLALKIDGVAFFIEPLRYNPLINLYRRMATEVRTKDERPVGFDILDQMRECFADIKFTCTWLLSLVIFVKYYLIDKVHPNDDRYWKRILHETERTRRWIEPLVKIDRVLCKICPPLKYLCWNIVIAARHPVNTWSY
ncbi:MAG: class I SAM-dependent methyltransferase [Nitrospirota bacterium]